MSWQKILLEENGRTLRKFLFTMCLIFFVLIAIKYMLSRALPAPTEGVAWWIQIADRVVDTILASMLTAVVIAFAIKVIDKPKPGPYQEAIFSSEISSRLCDWIKDSHNWTYMGHIGNYTRNNIFPKILARAAKTKQFNVCIMIIDPTNESLCEAYVREICKRPSNKVRNIDWTKQYLQAQLITTVVKTIVLGARDDNIYYFIGFMSWYSDFRYDSSDRNTLITQENPQTPAYIVSEQSKFYDGLRADQSRTRGHCKRFEVSKDLKTLAEKAWHSQSQSNDVEKTIAVFNAIRSTLKNSFCDITDLDTVFDLVLEALKKDKPYYD